MRQERQSGYNLQERQPLTTQEVFADTAEDDMLPAEEHLHPPASRAERFTRRKSSSSVRVVFLDWSKQLRKNITLNKLALET